VAAISSDFDLGSPPQVSQLHEILDPLKAEAITQNHDDAIDFNGAVRTDTSTAGSTLDSKSRSYDTEETTSGVCQSRADGKSTSESDGNDGEHFHHYDRLALPEKEEALTELFPNISQHTIKFRLRKLGGNFSRVVDELLHESFLMEEERNTGVKLIARGVEGFSAHGSTGRGRKKGKKKQRNGNRTAQRSNLTPAPATDAQQNPGNSVWQTGQEDVNFICSRTSLSQSRISSMYHANGASIAATLKLLIDQEIQTPTPIAHELVIEQFAQELNEDFPRLPSGYSVALIRLAYPSTSSAHELAGRYLSSLTPHKSTGGIEIIPRLPPVDLGDSAPFLKSSPGNTMTLQSATQATLSSTTARNTALGQAAESYRKANSKNHMGGAAAYYSELGRDHNDRLKGLSAAAADALINSKSTTTQLDLHGVSVKDAVRITRERTSRWWTATTDARLDGKRGAAGTFTIITGVGNHSEGGRGKIGPAVGRMLLREGWQVSIDSGSLVVYGLKRSGKK
jgi:hypothetical protein